MIGVMQAEALKEFITTVWGNPTLESNVTVIPKKETTAGPRNVGVLIRNISVKFPTAGFYHVYIIGRPSTDVLHKLAVKAGVWVSAAEFCNVNDCSLRFGYLNTLEIPEQAGISFMYLQGVGLMFIVPDNDAGDKLELHMTIRSSKLVTRHSINTGVYRFPNQSARDALSTLILADPNVLYREYLIDNYWVDRPTRADINAATSVTIVDDTSVEDIVDYDLASLDNYVVAGKGYLLLHYPSISEELMLNVNDIVVVLIKDRKGYVIHTGAYPGTINQLTSNACGLDASVVESVLESLGWQPKDVTLRLRLSTGGANKLKGNFNYQYVTKQMKPTQQYHALLGLYDAPDVLRADWQHTSTRNRYLNASYDLVKSKVEDIYGIGELDRLFNLGVRPGERVDNNLINLAGTNLRVAKAYTDGYVVDTYPTTLLNSHTALWMEHLEPMVFNTQSALVSEYTNPIVYKQTGGLGETGIDYRINNGVILPLSPVYITEMASYGKHTMEENNQRLYIPPNLKEYLACGNIHIFAGGIYLHPGIDYRLDEQGLSLWKAIPHDPLELNVEPRFIECVVEQGFIHNGVLSVNGSYLIEDPDNYVVFIGDRLYFPKEIMWEEDYIKSEANLPNGKPYTILKRLMNSYDKPFDVISALRTEHQETLASISAYANLVPPPEIHDPTLYSVKYKLLSPFLVELRARMANGEINYDPTFVNKVGVRNTIGADLLAKLTNDRDPLAVNWGTQMVEIAPHIYDTPQPMSSHGFSYLVRVNETLLGGKVNFNNYYRIVS